MGNAKHVRSTFPPALSICFHLLIKALRAADMYHQPGQAQERRVPARGEHHPLEKAAGKS